LRFAKPLTSYFGEVHRFWLEFFTFLCHLRITSIENNPHVAVDAEMVHEEPHRATFIEIGACLLKEWINRKFKVKLLGSKLVKRFG
jgi:hypothetical protein